MILCPLSIVLKCQRGEFSVSVSVLKCQSLNASSVVGRSKGSVLQLKLCSTEKNRIYFNFNKYILLFRQIHIYAMQHTITQGLSGAKSCDALDQSRAPREKWCTVFITSHLVCANQSASKQVLISVVIMCIMCIRLQPRICWCPVGNLRPKDSGLILLTNAWSQNVLR